MSLLLCATAHGAPATIESVWAFNGGQVAIIRQADGTYDGIVDSPTTFARCAHPVGEQMWTDIRAQPDGSYWGLHQWFFETEPCALNPTLGPTAWRVMTASNGSRYLLVCFSNPGTAQPTIAADGATAHVTYRCYESARVAAVPVQPAPSSRTAVQAFTNAVTLPATRQCVSRRAFQIHLHNPPYDPIKQATVTIRGRRVTVARHGTRFSATIDLRGLPQGTFVVTVRITTILGHHLSGHRTYHTCVPKRPPRRPRGG